MKIHGLSRMSANWAKTQADEAVDEDEALSPIGEPTARSRQSTGVCLNGNSMSLLPRSCSALPTFFQLYLPASSMPWCPRIDDLSVNYFERVACEISIHENAVRWWRCRCCYLPFALKRGLRLLQLTWTREKSRKYGTAGRRAVSSSTYRGRNCRKPGTSWSRRAKMVPVTKG
eukprot:6181636-Pleurochrysis_carterae.AAC.1